MGSLLETEASADVLCGPSQRFTCRGWAKRAGEGCFRLLVVSRKRHPVLAAFLEQRLTKLVCSATIGRYRPKAYSAHSVLKQEFMA